MTISFAFLTILDVNSGLFTYSITFSAILAAPRPILPAVSANPAPISLTPCFKPLPVNISFNAEPLFAIFAPMFNGLSISKGFTGATTALPKRATEPGIFPKVLAMFPGIVSAPPSFAGNVGPEKNPPDSSCCICGLSPICD